MVNVFIRHRVKDYSSWNQVFDDYIDTRTSAGEKSYRIMHPENDPNDLILLFEWDTDKTARAFMESDDLKETMEKAGVAQEPQIVFMQEYDSGTL